MKQNFDALIWVICAFQNELKRSQIDSSRDLGYISIFNRQKQPYIDYFTTKYLESQSRVLIQAVLIYW